MMININSAALWERGLLMMLHEIWLISLTLIDVVLRREGLIVDRNMNYAQCNKRGVS